MNTYIIGKINAMQAFVEHFPLSLLDFFKGKKYDNMLDFILDVLYACGVDVEAEINKLICKIFKVENTEVFDPNVLYDMLASNTNIDVESKFLDELEDVIKVAIIESFLALLGCAAIPEIKNRHMDLLRYECTGVTEPIITTGNTVSKATGLTVTYGTYETPSTGGGYISIPVSAIDLCGKFNISPISSTGMCIYNFEKKPTFTATRAYTYCKATYTIDNTVKTKYFLNKSEAESFVNLELNAAKMKASLNGGSYTNTGSTISVHSEGLQQSFASMDDAIIYAGYIDKESGKNGTDEQKAVYKLLSENRPALLKKSYYKKFVTTTPPCSANEIYKTKDFDAFLWYVLKRGDSSTQYEKNKMVWDNRRYLTPRDADEWEYWLNSKQKDGDFIFQQADEPYLKKVSSTSENLPNNLIAYKYNPKGIYPIMQLFKDPVFASEDRIGVAFSAQRYYRGSLAKSSSSSIGLGILKLNHTMYKFNYDYMKSIKIFSARQILAGYLNELLNGTLFDALGISFGFNAAVLMQQISNVVRDFVETGDFSSSDCYYKFSNDTYDMMLYRNELNRYSATTIGSSGMPAATVDAESIIDEIEGANTSSTMAGTVSSITRMTNMFTSESTTNEMNADAYFKFAGWKTFLYKIIMAIIQPIIMCLFAPKVMLVFILNFYAAGLLDINDINSFKDIQDLIMKKMFTILKSLIKLLLDKIIELLLEIFYTYIAPLLSAYIAQALIEYMEKWLKLLKEVLKCVPMFNWSKYKLQVSLDNVRYADIAYNEQQMPENNSPC